jgi:hypothetical protein
VASQFEDGGKTARSGGALGKKVGILLTSRRAFVTVFQNIATSPRRRRLSAQATCRAWESALAIRAKPKWNQVIENKQFREMIDFAAPMMSMTYDPVAKPLVSFGETWLSLSPFSSPSRPKTKWRRLTAFEAPSRRLGARGVGRTTTRKWRRKPLE